MSFVKESLKLLFLAAVVIMAVYFLNIGENGTSTEVKTIVVTATPEATRGPSAMEECEARGKYYELTMYNGCQFNYDWERSDYYATQEALIAVEDEAQEEYWDSIASQIPESVEEPSISATAVFTTSVDLPSYENYMAGCVNTDSSSQESYQINLAYCENGFAYLQRIEQDTARLPFILNCDTGSDWDYCSHQYDTLLEEAPLDWREAVDHIGKWHIVCGNVAGTHFAETSSGQPTFIHLGANHPDPDRVQIIIWNKNRSHFTDAPELFYKDKSLCVRGWIELYEEVVQIEASTPLQIQVQ